MSESRVWLVPCNVKGFDIVEYLKKNNTACLKKNRGVAAGDTVYLYVAKPYSEILFKGKVLRSGLRADSIDAIFHVEADRSVSYFEFEVEKSFTDHRFTFDAIKKAEIGQVVNQQLIAGRALIKITAIENQ